MNPGYNLWYMHGETTTGFAIPGQCSSYHSGTDTAACSTEHGEVTEQEGVAVEQDDFVLFLGKINIVLFVVENYKKKFN
jgi:hypothetical protein